MRAGFMALWGLVLFAWAPSAFGLQEAAGASAAALDLAHVLKAEWRIGLAEGKARSVQDSTWEQVRQQHNAAEDRQELVRLGKWDPGARQAAIEGGLLHVLAVDKVSSKKTKKVTGTFATQAGFGKPFNLKYTGCKTELRLDLWSREPGGTFEKAYRWSYDVDRSEVPSRLPVGSKNRVEYQADPADDVLAVLRDALQRCAWVDQDSYGRGCEERLGLLRGLPEGDRETLEFRLWSRMATVMGRQLVPYSRRLIADLCLEAWAGSHAAGKAASIPGACLQVLQLYSPHATKLIQWTDLKGKDLDVERSILRGYLDRVTPLLEGPAFTAEVWGLEGPVIEPRELEALHAYFSEGPVVRGVLDRWGGATPFRFQVMRKPSEKELEQASFLSRLDGMVLARKSDRKPKAIQYKPVKKIRERDLTHELVEGYLVQLIHDGLYGPSLKK